MKLALSTSPKGVSRERLEACKSAGIEAIEVSVGNAAFTDGIDFNAIRSLANEYGITLWSFHLPFAPFEEIDISMPSLADHTVEYFCSLIAKIIIFFSVLIACTAIVNGTRSCCF